MKGLLKGLRYISEIFEADDEKEPEIQIGAPTDVKHIAHIGCDGPSSNAPSWMNEFHGDPGSSDLKGSDSSMGSPTRRGKSKQKKQGSKNKSSASDNESSRARRSKNSGMGSESPAQDPGAKKNRKKKRASNRDSSAIDSGDETKGDEMRVKQGQGS